MKKFFKIIGVIGFTSLLLIAVVFFAFYHLIQVGEFRRFLIAEFEEHTQLKISVGEADLEMGKILGISFSDFALREPDSEQPIITSERIVARVAFLPLLHRKLIFSEIRLIRPVIDATQDETGKVPWMEKLLNLPFLKEEGEQFSLDLREIKLEKGEVLTRGLRASESETATYFRDIDLNLRPIRERLIKVSDPNAQGQALEFNLRAVIEKGVWKVGLKSKGNVVFPDSHFKIRQALWEADTQVTDLPADLLRQYSSRFISVQAMSGMLQSRFRWQGSLDRKIHLNGEMEFSRLAIEAPNLFAEALTPGGGHMDVEIEWTPRSTRFSRLDFRSKELNFAAKGLVRSLDGNDFSIEVGLTTPFQPLVIVKKYLPLKALESPQLENIFGALNQGELKLSRAGVSGRLTDLKRLKESGLENPIWFDAELRDAGARLGERYLPLRGIQGKVIFEKGVLHFKNIQAVYGLSRFSEIDGSYQGILRGPEQLEIQAKGEADLAQLHQQLKLSIFPEPLSKVASSLQEMDGKGRFGLSLRKTSTAPYEIHGKISLEQVRLRMDDWALSEIKGDLALSPQQVRVEKATALLSGSPLNIRLYLNQYLSDTGSFDLRVDSPGVKAGVMTRLLFSSGSLEDPGTVRGWVRYYGPLNAGAEKKLSGVLDLAGVQLARKPLLQPLRELSGRVRFDEEVIDFRGMKGRFAGSGFDFTGQWRYTEKPQLVFTFGSPELDLNYLLSQIDEESGDWYDRLQAKGTVSILKGRFEGFEFSDLKTEVALEKRLWHLTDFFARSAGGAVQGVGSIADYPDKVGFTLEPKVKGVPVRGFLSWFDIGKTEITGKVNLTGSLESIGKNGAERKKNLNGAFQLRVEDGTVRRMRILVQILNLLDLSRWFTLQMPDLNKKGIHFRSITGDFKVTKGVYSTQNLLVDSDDLRMTGGGKIDVPQDDIDFVVAVRPFPGIDTVINFIPLIGRGIAAIKNSFLVASFRIKGPIDDPTITPAPLSTLSEVFFGVLGVPKSIIGLSDEEKKGQTTEPPK